MARKKKMPGREKGPDSQWRQQLEDAITALLRLLQPVLVRSRSSRSRSHDWLRIERLELRSLPAPIAELDQPQIDSLIRLATAAECAWDRFLFPRSTPLTPELRQWVLSQCTKEELAANLREARENPGPSLGDLITELEQGSAGRERTGP